jgi:NAD(P)-dependent dehydrogenase (short-subunit alcohol dehydrogenase family)
MTPEVRLDGRVAVVTGAGRGLGRSHAIALADRGAKVVVNDLGGTITGESSSPEPGADVVAEILSRGGEAVANADDVSLATGGQAVVERALKAFGRLDIVVANAGIAFPGRPFMDTSLDSVNRMLAVHLGGTYNVIRAAWPVLVEQGYGRVVTTGSSGGFYGQPGMPEYSAAKGAIMGFTASLAHESQRHGILVNCLAPAAMTRMSGDLDVDPATAAAIANLLRVELVSPAVVWLASDACTYNGRYIQAGGGRVARVLVGEGTGYWSQEPTPEQIVENEDTIMDSGPLTFHQTSMEWAGWLLEAGSKEQASPSA